MAQEPTNYGTWEREMPGGPPARLVADTPADQVKFMFDGWKRVDEPAEPAGAAPSNAEPDSAEPDGAEPSAKPKSSK